MRAIIFDLDQTLVDSLCIEHLRRSRQWTIVYQKIPTILAYDGINEILSITRDRGIKLAIVSSSPSRYVQRVVQQRHRVCTRLPRFGAQLTKSL